MNHVGTRAKIFFYTALATALLAYAAVVINAYARVSLARVGCPAWYDCYGRTPETNQGQALTAAPTYANTPWQAKVHPFLAAALAILVIRLVVLGRQWDIQPNRRVVIPAIAFVLLFVVVLPDVPIFGSKVPPWVAMVQLLATLAVLALLWWLVMREQRFCLEIGRGVAAYSAVTPACDTGADAHRRTDVTGRLVKRGSGRAAVRGVPHLSWRMVAAYGYGSRI